MPKTAVVTLTDAGYYQKAKRTIMDVRSRGEWTGDLVLITVGFDAPPNFLDYYRVTPFRVEHLDTTQLVAQYKKDPIRPTCDNREYGKLTQWDKFYVFDAYFLKWDRVVYLDAGLRCFRAIDYLASLPCENAFMAPDDAAAYDHAKRFGGIIETDRHPEIVGRLFQEYSPLILTERYFLNCIWVYDTAILRTFSMHDLVDTMNKYPICRCNEMTVMNLVIAFKHRLWKPFPEHIADLRTRLFGWTERDRDYGPYTTWRDFCFVKYPSTINFDCE